MEERFAALEARFAAMEARVAALEIPAETAEACRDGGAAVDNDIDEVSALAVAFAHGSGDAESAHSEGGSTVWQPGLAVAATLARKLVLDACDELACNRTMA